MTTERVKHPGLDLRDLLILTTLAALVIWQVTALGWTDDERWLLGLAGGGSLLGILMGRLWRGKSWHWSVFTGLLGGLLGGVASIWPAATRLLAEQAVLKPSPERDELCRILLGTRISNPLVGFALATLALLLFQLGRWITSSHPYGIARLSSRYPGLASAVAVLIAATAWAQFVAQPTDGWYPRAFAPTIRKGRKVDLSEYCTLAVSRDGSYAALCSAPIKSAYRWNCETWVFDLRKRPREVQCQTNSHGTLQRLSFGSDCDQLAVSHSGTFSILSLLDGKAALALDGSQWKGRPHSAPPGITALQGPWRNHVWVRYVSRYEDDYYFLVDVASGERTTGDDHVPYQWVRGDLLTFDPFTKAATGRIRSIPSKYPSFAKFSPDAKAVIYRTSEHGSVKLRYARDGRPTAHHERVHPLWTFTKSNHVVGSRPIEQPPGSKTIAPAWFHELPLVGRLVKPITGEQIVLLDPVTLQELAATHPLRGEVFAVAVSYNGAVMTALTKDGLYVYDVPAKFR